MAGVPMELPPCSKELADSLVESLYNIHLTTSDEKTKKLMYTIKTFPAILVDIVSLFVKQATENAREFSQSCQSAEANIQQLQPFFTLGWLLGRSPQITNLIYNYFENSSFQPLPEESFQFTSPKQHDIAYTYPGFNDELVKTILTTYFKYLSFNPKWFGAVWNWSELGRFISVHPNTDVKYLAACCLSVITRPSHHQHIMFLQDIIPNPEQLIGTQLKYAEIFRHKSRPLVGTSEKETEALTKVFGPSETGQYEICSESIAKVSNSLLPKRDTSLLSNHMRKTIEKNLNRFVTVPAINDTLSRIAYASSVNKPCLLRGPSGSGKTSILDYIAAHTNRIKPPDYIKVQVGDQIDSKSLVGSYVCTEIPGQFEWQAGPLTQALAYGSWIVFEDINSAPAEMAQVIHSVIENGNLSCVSCCPIKMDNPHPDFKIFFTQRTRNYNERESLKLGFGFIERLCDIVEMPELSDEDLKEILDARYQLGQLTDTILKLFHSAQESVLTANISRATRPLTFTDLFKYCDRVSKKGIRVVNDRFASSDLDGLLVDAIDCYIASLPSKHRQSPARSLGEILNKPSIETDAMLTRQPVIREDGRSYTVGRAKLEIRNQDRQVSEIHSRSIFAHTRQSLQLLESVSHCVNNREPVLLVGETGVGKTTIVQHIANLVNSELTVINLSQQSDSSDLLCGIRPVDMREIIKPIHEEFCELIQSSYNFKPDEKFSSKVEGHYLGSKKSSDWMIYLKLVGSLCKQSLMQPFSEENLKRWTELSVRARRLRKRLSDGNSSPMALSFAEGTLLQAVRKGKWILLDEINLAEPEVLQCLLLIIDSLKDSHVYIQSTSDKDGSVFINPNFRIFACMNPSTDIGKRDLPLGIRGRFTEFFVDDVDEPHDLRLIVESYVKTCLKPHYIEKIVNFYREIRIRASILSDVSGNSPVFSLRSLCRALVICSQNVCKNIEKSLFESLKITFLQQLNHSSVQQVVDLIERIIYESGSIKQLTNLEIPMPQDSHKYIEVEKFWIQISSQQLYVDNNYILTASVKSNLRRIARILCLGQRRLPILIQGNTSVGKTSLIKYLAQLSGNLCYRINNHEHTDLQEYVGKYVLRETGELQWQDGLLTRAMKKGYWVILDELNLAPSELLEALNRVLDDNRELFIPETKERFCAHSKFVLFATQNPPTEYAGRKLLSRAFRNRFVELHFDELPHNELEEILHRRCHMPPKYANKIVCVMKELQMFRRESVCFGGKNSFMTIRDLFRWGHRYLVFKDTVKDDELLDWNQFLANQGLILLEGRVRTINEADIVKSIIEKVFKTKLDRKLIYESELSESFFKDGSLKTIHFSPEFKRLYVQLSEALKYNEPVLLCGQTGCGKTTACQMYAKQTKTELVTYNCHANTESSDFVGNVRPSRDSSKDIFPWNDGPLVRAMKNGSLFLLDEISLADDAVLERLNSVLEPERSITLTERDGQEVVANEMFRIVATMNPGGDYGKKELSTALKNRFTEIYCHNTTNIEQIMMIIQKSLAPALSTAKIAPPLLKTIGGFLKSYYHNQDLISLRDILSWTAFLNETTNIGRNSTLSVQDALIDGAFLVFFDQFGTCSHNALHLNASPDWKTDLLNDLISSVKKNFGNGGIYQSKLTSGFQKSGDYIKLGKFSIRKGPNPLNEDSRFIIDSPTVGTNTEKLVRALQLDRPILLEGDPGSGKTSIVAALANLSGHKLVRVNLSDQTDISDLFGSDLPDPSYANDEQPRFCWHDGPILKAIKESSWILLDEMNLASQSVLEGLNACFDHRGEIYISELNKTIMVDRSTTRIFACQNPFSQGSARKGLPQSFVNRFTSIYITSHSDADLMIILGQLYPALPKDLLDKMIRFNRAVSNTHELQGYEFNLRDLIYWCDLVTRYVNEKDLADVNLYEPDRFVQFVYIDRMRSLTLKSELSYTFEKIFGQPVYEPPYRDIKLGEHSFLMARASLQRKTRLPPQIENLCILKYQMPYIESITKAIEFNKMPILVGEPGVGKRSMVKILACLTGNELNVIGANRDMDTIELLGSYEQKSLQREMVDLVDQATRFTLTIINSIPKQSTDDSLKRLFKHVWSTLYSTSIRENRLAKNELMEAYRFQLTQLESLVEKLQTLSINHTEFKCKDILQMISNLKKKVLFESDSTYSSGNFEWVDSLLIKSIKEGKWLLIENANLMNPATLDRLNSLVEPDGTLCLNEKGSGPDGIEVVKAHPDFRLILTMSPEHGELSRAMRNRGVEIFVRARFYYEDFLIMLNSVGLPIVPGTACMTYCIMQTSYDAHVNFTGERPENDGNLLAHFGLNYSSVLSHQKRRGVAIDNVLSELFISYYRQRGHLVEVEDSTVESFIVAKMAEYKEAYVVVISDDRYKWLNFRHDLRAMIGGDAITAMLHNEKKLLKEWNCPLSIGLLKFDEMIENSDIVFCCTSIKILMELASPNDFEYRRRLVELQYSENSEPFFKRMLELIEHEIGSLQQECLPIISSELPSSPIKAVDMYVDTRNAPDFHHTLLSLSFKRTVSREDLQNRWILSLYRINLFMITDQIERTSHEVQEGCQSLYALSERVKASEMLQQDLIRPQAMIASDLFEFLNGLVRLVSNRCFANSLVPKLMGRLFWINYFSCKLKRAFSKEELIATCNQISMLWALTYQKVVVPLIEDCELADVSLSGKKISNWIKFICDFLDVNVTKPSKSEKQYYQKVVNRFAATTKRSETIYTEIDKLFTTLILRYTIKSQALGFMSENTATLAASNLVWSNSMYMSTLYTVTDLLLEIDAVQDDSPDGIQAINEKLGYASTLLVTKRNDYDAHERLLATDSIYQDQCLSVHKRRCGLDQFSPIWQARFVHCRLAQIFNIKTEFEMLKQNQQLTRAMLNDVNGVLMSPRYYSTLNKFISAKSTETVITDLDESCKEESIIGALGDSKTDFDRYAAFLVDHMLENIVLDNQVVGWIKMRVTTSDLSSSAPIIPEYSPIVSLVSGYCLDLNHLKLNSYHRSSPQLDSMMAYLWRAYAQIKFGVHSTLDSKMAQDLLHLRVELDGPEEVVGSYICLKSSNCGCLDAFARRRAPKYDENNDIIRNSADAEDKSLILRAYRLIHFGYYHMIEYAPIFTLDPSLRSREKSEVYKAELAHAKIDLHLRNTLHYWKTGENLRLVDVSPDESKLYPFSIRALIERRAKLERSLKKLRLEFINRPKSDDGAIYYELKKEVEIAVTRNTQYITTLINDLSNYLTSKKPELRTRMLSHLNTKIRMYIKNLERSINRFKSDFVLYTDLTTHYITGLCFILQGMRLLCARVEQKMRLIDMNFKHCLVDKFSRNVMRLFSFNNLTSDIMVSIDRKRTLYPLLQVICPEDSISHAQSLLLRSILLHLNHHIMTTPSDIKLCIPIVRNVADRFHKAWLERKKYVEEQRQKQEELYQYKASSSTIGYQTSLERQEFFDIANKFPIYDHIYHDNVESLPHNDQVNFETEAKIITLNHNVHLGMCIDVCKAHYKFMKEASLNLLGDQSFVEEQRSREIEMDQLVKLETELLYKVIRECILNFDGKFDSMSIECHILQANELIKSLRQSQPNQFQTGSLRSSIEILDEEIFDIYHNACPFETLRFQEMLAKVDERVNFILASKKFDKQPTISSITKLTSRISSFLVTDPLMKFVTGAHALLQLLEEWNKITPKEFKMIKEADDLIALIHSWRGIELKSWRSSLHRVKRKYIDDTLCDLWFRLYEAFNDPFGSTKKFLIRQGYDEEDVKEMTPDEIFYQGFVWLVKDFFEEATLGDYQIRLDLVFSFAIQTRFASLYEQSKSPALQSIQKIFDTKKGLNNNDALIDYDKLTTYVYNIYCLYRGIMISYKETLSQEESVLSTELNNEIRVVNWQGRNLWEIKNNFRISHRKLNRVMNKYSEVLRKPVRSVMTHATNQATESPKSTNSVELTEIFKKTNQQIEQTLQQIAGRNQSTGLSSLQKAQAIVSKMVHFEKEITDSSRNRYVDVIESLESMIENNHSLIESFNSQRAQDLIIHERDSKEVKMDKLKECRQIFNSKKFSMQTIFKNLQQIGVSFQRGLINKQKLDGSILSLEPLRGMIQNQSNTVLKAAAALVDDSLIASCNEMYREVVTKNQSLLSQPRREDLTGDQIERIQGYSLDMVLDIIMHKKYSALVYRHLIDIQASTERLRQLQLESNGSIIVYNFPRFHDSVKRFKELASRTYLSLSKLDMLMDCYKTYSDIQNADTSSKPPEDIRERKILSKMIGQVHKNYSLLTDSQHDHIQRNLPEVRKGLAKVNADLRDKLKYTIKNYIYSDNDVQDIQDIFRCFINSLKLLIPPKCDKYINARPGTILGSIRALRVEAEQNLQPLLSKEYLAGEIDHADMNSHSKLERLNTRLLKLMKQIKLVTQELYKEEKNYLINVESAKRKAKTFNHIDIGNLRKILRASQVAHHTSNCLMTLNSEARSLDVTPVIVELAPLLTAYTQGLARYLNVILKSMHVRLISANQLITFFTSLAICGFGLPCKIEDLKDESHDQTASKTNEDNVGFGEGEGKDDASKKLEYESQLDETKVDEKESSQEGEQEGQHIDAHDDGVEMTDDFDAKAEGPEPDNEQEQSNSDEEEDDQRLDDLDKNLDTVDEEEGLLDREIWDDEEDPIADDDEDDLRETNLNQSIKQEEKDLMAKNADLKESKSDDDTPDNNVGDENEADEPNDESTVEEKADPKESNNTDPETTTNEDEQNNLQSEESRTDEADFEDLDEDDPLLELLNQDDFNIEEQDKNDDDKLKDLEMDVSDVDDAKNDEKIPSSPSNQQGVEADDNETDQICGEDVEMSGNNDEETQQVPKQDEKSSNAQGNNQDTGGPEDVCGEQASDTDSKGKRTFADRSSIDVDQQIKRQKIEEAANNPMKDNPEQMQKDDEQVQHIEKDIPDAIEVIDILSESEDDCLLEGDDEIKDKHQSNSRNLSSKRDQGERKDEEDEIEQETPVKHQQHSSYNTNLGLLRYISHSMTGDENVPGNDSMKEDIMKNIDDILKQSNQGSEHESLETDRLTSLWLECTQSNAHLVNELCQQLQIVLQPTKMSKYKGDYKSGKRLNMRKVISYIASQYRKDKIWLRRTKPSKRTFNISIAVDNSSSMSENNCRQMTYQSLALLAKSLSIIEAGSLSVVSFGEQVKCIHDFDQPYVDAIGAHWLRELRFHETKTSYSKLLRYSCTSFVKQSQNSPGINNSVNQLLIIISDGRNVTSEDDEVKLLLRQLKSKGVLVLFIIIDDLKQNNGKSIMDVKSCVKYAGKIQVEDYMDLFPFPFYLLLRQIDAMPSVLGDALRQWFELVSNHG